MTTQTADSRLVVRIRDGDLEALGELYERHNKLVYRTALGVTGDERAAEDILQETFLRVYTYASTIDENMPLEPWLYRVTVNVAYSWASRVKRWLYSLQGTFDQWVSPDQRHPEAATEEQEWRQALHQAIDDLPLRHRAVIVLYYLEGLSLKEIASVIGVPEGTVKSRLYYARESLRQAILDQESRLIPEVAYDFT
jgi:RNA polymerase sigma-70 factor (ECF subfamily)